MPPRFSKPSHFTADSQTVIIRGPGLALTRRPPAGSPHSCTIPEDSVCGLEVDMTVQVVEGLADATISQVECKHYGIRSSAGISEPQTTHCCRVTRHSARAFKFGPHPGRDWAVTKPVLPVSCQKLRYNNSGRGVLEILKSRPSFLRTLAVCVLEFLVDHCPRTWTLASLAALRTHSIFQPLEVRRPSRPFTHPLSAHPRLLSFLPCLPFVISEPASSYVVFISDTYDTDIN